MDGFDAVEAEGAFLLAEMTPANEVANLVMFLDPVGGDGAGGDLTVGWPSIANSQIVTVCEGTLDDGFWFGGWRHGPGRQLQVAGERGLETGEQLVGGAFGFGQLLGGQLRTERLA